MAIYKFNKVIPGDHAGDPNTTKRVSVYYAVPTNQFWKAFNVNKRSKNSFTSPAHQTFTMLIAMIAILILLSLAVSFGEDLWIVIAAIAAAAALLIFFQLRHHRHKTLKSLFKDFHPDEFEEVRVRLQDSGLVCDIPTPDYDQETFINDNAAYWIELEKAIRDQAKTEGYHPEPVVKTLHDKLEFPKPDPYLKTLVDRYIIQAIYSKLTPEEAAMDADYAMIQIFPIIKADEHLAQRRSD